MHVEVSGARLGSGGCYGDPEACTPPFPGEKLFLCIINLNQDYNALSVSLSLHLFVSVAVSVSVSVSVDASSLRHELSLTCTLKWPGRNRVQITCNTSSAYHVHPAVYHLVRRDSSAIKFDRVEIAFYYSFILLAETFNRFHQEGSAGLCQQRFLLQNFIRKVQLDYASNGFCCRISSGRFS